MILSAIMMVAMMCFSTQVNAQECNAKSDKKECCKKQAAEKKDCCKKEAAGEHKCAKEAAAKKDCCKKGAQAKAKDCKKCTECKAECGDNNCKTCPNNHKCQKNCKK